MGWIVEQDRPELRPRRRFMLAFRHHEEGVGPHHRRQDPGALGTGESCLEATGAVGHDGPQEMLERRFQGDGLRRAYRCGPAEGEQVAGHGPDRGPRKQLKGHHGADRIAREADPRDTQHLPEPDRRARPHPQLPEIDRTAQRSHRLTQVVMLAHTDAGGRHQEVALGGALEVCTDAGGRIPRDAEGQWNAAGQSHQGVQRVTVGTGDLPTTEDGVALVHVDDLVAAAENADDRPAKDQRMGDRERGQDAELGGAQLRAELEDRGPPANVLAGVPDVDADIAVVPDGDDLPSEVGVLLAHDGVGAGRERRAGEDAGAFAGLQCPGRKGAGGDLLDDAEAHRPVRGGAPHVVAARGVAVHGRVGPGGKVEGADHGFRQDGPEGVVEWNTQGRLPGDGGQDTEGGLARGERAHGPMIRAPSHPMLARNWSHIVSRKRRTRQSA